jgi:tetratricopeptide (TPR) repeat protein
MNNLFLLLISILCVIFFLIFVANEWRKAYRLHRAAQREQSTSEARGKQSSSWGMLLGVLSLGGLAFAVEAMTGFDARLVALIVVVGGLAMLAMAIIFLPRWRHRDAFRMVRLVESNRSDEAVFRIRQEIENKGPSAERWNLLAVALSLQENWGEALRAFEEAERLGVPQPTDLANKGSVLWKMGRLEDAEEHLESAYLKEPNNFTTVSNYCLLLVDAKKIEKATQLLREAEALDQRQVILWPRSARRNRIALLEECRRKVRGTGQNTVHQPHPNP